MVICLERGADLHIAQLMPLPLTVSCSSKIQIGFTFLVLAYPGCPGKEAVKWLLCCLSFDVFKVCDLLFMAATSVLWNSSVLFTCDDTLSLRSVNFVFVLGVEFTRSSFCTL